MLGSIAAQKFIDEGHFVTSFALPPIPKGANIPPTMELILDNFMHMKDADIKAHMMNSEVFVFAAGIDERVEGKYPIYEMYKRFNIDALERLIKIAKEAKIKKIIVLGSYFSYFDREWRDLSLYNTHPYIRSRVDQANMALSYADESTQIIVLELPYIFGIQEGRKPVWVFLVKQILKMRFYTFYPAGGTTMLTANQVGDIIVGISKSDYRGNLPVGYYNLTWKQMLHTFHEAMGIERKIVTIPVWLYRMALGFVKKSYKKRGLDSGLDFKGLAEIMSRNAFIENTFVKNQLKVPDDDIHQAIKDSVRLSLNVINGDEEIIEMKAE